MDIDKLIGLTEEQALKYFASLYPPHEVYLVKFLGNGMYVGTLSPQPVVETLTIFEYKTGEKK